MAGLLAGAGRGNAEPHALFMGTLAILSATIFFLEKSGALKLAFRISNETYLMFFAIFTLVSGIVHLLTTLGFIGAKSA